MESLHPLEKFGPEHHKSKDVQRVINRYKDVQSMLGKLAVQKREQGDMQDIDSQIFLLRKEKRKLENDLELFDVDIDGINKSKPELYN